MRKMGSGSNCVAPLLFSDLETDFFWLNNHCFVEMQVADQTCAETQLKCNELSSAEVLLFLRPLNKTSLDQGCSCCVPMVSNVLLGKVQQNATNRTSNCETRIWISILLLLFLLFIYNIPNLDDVFWQVFWMHPHLPLVRKTDSPALILCFRVQQSGFWTTVLHSLLDF